MSSADGLREVINTVAGEEVVDSEELGTKKDDSWSRDAVAVGVPGVREHRTKLGAS